jgi:peptide/nickel transport system substrate-binding protein
MASTGNADPISCLQYKSIYGGYNTSNYKDDKAAAMFNAAIATTDATSRDNQFKLLNQYVLDQVEIIGMPDPYQFGSYWPWVKNFYNEVEGGYINYTPIVSRMWIDPAVKKKLGY